MDYKQIISNLSSDWINTDGAGTIIAVIDTGIVINNIHFNSTLLNQIDIINAPIGSDDYHGTFIFGILGANGNLVRGIAVKANITSLRYKVANSGFNTILNNLKTALIRVKEIRATKNDIPIIVNISQGFNSYQVRRNQVLINDITSLVKELILLNAVIVCAAGENDNLDDNNLLFPASLDETIAVGCISEDYQNSISKHIDIIMPFVPFESFNNSFKVVEDSGSSFSAALISGIISLLISYKKNNSENILKNNIINELKKYNTQLSSFNYSKLDRLQFYIP